MALSQTEQGRNGCLVCNSSSEDIATDDDVRGHINRYFARIESAYQNALTRSKTRGELDWSDQKIMTVSRLLLGTHVSLCVLARASQSQDVLNDIAEETLAMLP